MKRTPKEETLMETAHLWARQSTCSRKEVGALLVQGSQIFSTGFNGSLPGFTHCDHRPFTDLDEDDPCHTAVHAEKNAIAFASAEGHSTRGADLYTTLSPCLDCAYLIAQCGIARVVYGEEYRDTYPLSILYEAGVELKQLGWVQW